jgi:hypothetical protein
MKDREHFRNVITSIYQWRRAEDAGQQGAQSLIISGTYATSLLDIQKYLSAEDHVTATV